MATPLLPDDVRARLGYARIRIDDLLSLHGGDLPGADADVRQRLTQEVFFHLVGAIEVFAQLVSERRNLGQPSERVTTRKLLRLTWLGPTDRLRPHVQGLYADTSNPAPASDPYSGDGLMWRIWNYRHQVTHRRANPFLIKLGLGGERRSPRRGYWWSTNPLGRLQRSTVPPDRSGHFLLNPLEPLDPTDPDKNVSQHSVLVDVHAMFVLVEERLEAAIAAL